MRLEQLTAAQRHAYGEVQRNKGITPTGVWQIDGIGREVEQLVELGFVRLGRRGYYELAILPCGHPALDADRCMPLGHTWRSEDLVQCDWRDPDDIDPDTGGPGRCERPQEDHEPCGGPDAA